MGMTGNDGFPIKELGNDRVVTLGNDRNRKSGGDLLLKLECIGFKVRFTIV